MEKTNQMCPFNKNLRDKNSEVKKKKTSTSGGLTFSVDFLFPTKILRKGGETFRFSLGPVSLHLPGKHWNFEWMKRWGVGGGRSSLWFREWCNPSSTSAGSRARAPCSRSRRGRTCRCGSSTCTGSRWRAPSAPVASVNATMFDFIWLTFLVKHLFYVKTIF